MEFDKRTYHARLAAARTAFHSGLFQQAVELAVSSLAHVDGMMQYERKYENRESFTIEAIGMVLQIAPLLLDSVSLDQLEEVLKNQRRIAKYSSDDLSSQLRDANALLMDAHRLWDLLERQVEAKQDNLFQALGGHRDRWRNITDTWESIGLIRRVPVGDSCHLSFMTQMDSPTLAKCPSCGVVVRVSKSRVLNALVCPKCKIENEFVILKSDPVSST